eukprot:1436430-Prymnesium_polylepis.1
MTELQTARTDLRHPTRTTHQCFTNYRSNFNPTACTLFTGLAMGLSSYISSPTPGGVGLVGFRPCP